MGVLLSLICVVFEVALPAARSHLYMVATGVAAATAFLMMWVNLAVGIVGSENNFANLMFFGVIAMIGAALARLESLGMARAMAMTALVQAATSGIAFASGEGRGAALIWVFVTMWLVSAQLFRKAAQQEARAANVR